MFNNNNYLPDLNHYPPTGQLPPSGSTSLIFQTPEPTASTYIRPGNFRFLSPTQGTAVPTWVPVTGTMTVATAPGIGTSWQHSVPLSMPWANPIAPHFTAQSALSQTLPVYTMQMAITPQTTMMQTSPKPSILSRGPKRRLQSNTAEIPDGPSSKRYLSESMAAYFKQLQITAEEPRGNNPADTALIPDCVYNSDNGWQRFREVEKRLEEDLEVQDMSLAMGEEAACSTSSVTDARNSTKTGAVLTISQEVEKEIKKSNPLLPESVLKNITKPCMDLILWQPPVPVTSISLTLPISSKQSITTSASSSQANNTQTVMATSCTRPQLSASTNQNPPHTFFDVTSTQCSGLIDTEMFDSLDDDMDL